EVERLRYRLETRRDSLPGAGDSVETSRHPCGSYPPYRPAVISDGVVFEHDTPTARVRREVKHSIISSCASQSSLLLFGSRRCLGGSVSRLRDRCDRSQAAPSGCARLLIGPYSSDVPQLQVKPLWIGISGVGEYAAALCKLPRVTVSSADAAKERGTSETKSDPRTADDHVPRYTALATTCLEVDHRSMP
ncbi:hypothetical protein PSPO01_06678, partial [Paraphaeosphaeria sporulosa]